VLLHSCATQAFMSDPKFGVEYDSSAGIDVAAVQNEAT
jgi:hypothetical protein